jgi:hypothetical protein
LGLLPIFIRILAVTQVAQIMLHLISSNQEPLYSLPWEGRTVGDWVAQDQYGDEFKFTGTIKRVMLDLSGELIPNCAVDMKIEMARSKNACHRFSTGGCLPR